MKQLTKILAGFILVSLFFSACDKDDNNDPPDPENTAPQAAFTVSPSSGTTQTQFAFDASGCSDEEDNSSSLQVRWDWENDGNYDTDWDTVKTIVREFSAAGDFTIKLEVKDSAGLSDTTSHVITVEDGVGNPCVGITEIAYGGQTYNTVEIGNQCWLKENLNIGEIISGDDDMTENGTIEKYCYDNDPANCDIYGGLYQWDEMMQYVTEQGAQGICPDGWHIPTDDEWKTLEGTVDSQYPVGDPIWNSTGFRGYDVGKNLKSTESWSNDGNGVDAYGYGALPGSYRYLDGSFTILGDIGVWWSSSEHSNQSSYRYILSFEDDGSNRYYYGKTNGFSIRCLKD